MLHQRIAAALSAILIATLGLTLGSCLGTAEAEPQAAVLTVEPTRLDMGDLVPDQTVTKRVKLTNRSTKPVTVTLAVADCSCTTPTWPTDPIAPGETVETDISIKPGPKQGVTLTKRVTFTLEEGDPVLLTVVGKVGLFIEQSTDILRAPADGTATPAPETVSLRGADNTPFRIVSIDQPFAVADNAASAMSHVVLVDWAKWREAKKPVKFSVYTDHPKSPELLVNIRRTAAATPPAPAAAATSNDEPQEGKTLVRGPVETVSGQPPRPYDLRQPTLYPGATVGFPPLGEFLQGTKRASYPRGQVVVFEFFATTCTHCQDAAPLIKALVDDFTPKGFEFIAVTSEDAAKVRAWLAGPEHAELVKHAVAIDNGSLAHKALQSPTFQSRTPRMFAIRDGLVLWIGHPDDARPVFGKIAAGQWSPDSAKDEFTENAVFARAQTHMSAMRTLCEKDGNWPDLLGLMESIATAIPTRASFFEAQKFGYMIGPAGMTDAGYAFGRRLAKKYETDADALRKLATVTLTWGSVQSRDLDFALAAATAADQLVKGSDARIAAMLATAYFSKGDREKALEHQQRAIGLCTSAKEKVQAEQQLQKFKTQDPKPLPYTPPAKAAQPVPTTAASDSVGPSQDPANH